MITFSFESEVIKTSSKSFPWMAMGSKIARSMNVRFLINQKSWKILYADARKDFVDLLFSVLILPRSFVIKILLVLHRTKNIGYLKNLYNSIEKLQSVFLNTDKSHLLELKFIFAYSNDILWIQSAPTL